MADRNTQIVKESRAEKIRLNEIDKGPAHIRSYVNEEDLEELKESIKKMGLLQPIVVMERKKVKHGERKYSLVVGSRRVRAHQELNEEKILAVIIDEQDQEKVLAASLSENMFRSKLSHKDMADAVTRLYKLYGNDEKKVAKETGMWPETILRYVYLKEYGTKNMLEWVEKGSVSLLDVKRMLNAAQWNIKKAEKWLEQMIKEEMTPTQKKNFAEYMGANPSATVKEGVDDARKPRVKNKLLVDLTPELRSGIAKAMKEWGMEADEVAAQAITDWLEDQGYLQ
jgi:ParB/RepB/Spo0J family partition protein